MQAQRNAGRCHSARSCGRSGGARQRRRAGGARFSVSRQIIVGDIALLRAAGAAISATPRGYVIRPARRQRASSAGWPVRHRCCWNKWEAELNAMVDNGCTVVDVIVEHPVYGQLTGPLQPLQPV